MAQITLHGVPRAPRLPRFARRELRAPQGRDRDRVRSVAPTLVAVALLLAVVVGGGLVLREWLDFGLWLAGQTTP